MCCCEAKSEVTCWFPSSLPLLWKINWQYNLSYLQVFPVFFFHRPAAHGRLLPIRLSGFNDYFSSSLICLINFISNYKLMFFSNERVVR